MTTPPTTTRVQAAIDQDVAELRADIAQRMFRLSEHVTWQTREVDAVVEIVRAEHRRRTGADAPGFAGPAKQVRLGRRS